MATTIGTAQRRWTMSPTKRQQMLMSRSQSQRRRPSIIQVKTWFQNQRMKFKRCQKETQWMEKGTRLSQAGYLDFNPSYHQGCPVSASRNIQTVTNVHQSYGSSQTYGSGQSLYPFVAIEEEGFFGKAGGACSAQQAMGFFSQQKMNFYHGFPANMDYASMETEDGLPLPECLCQRDVLPE
ncbi:hypothetical protein KIL84_008108 [Mauremys mutica]|uniref:Homeobox domain-containing protein n=1 Tax=Mauremys mutica TaxID=74926 RepID=A0A9D3WN49_9SAUR|nr:hypothetical protein KIL84_008108 [Mauremys mutica]